MWNVTPTSSTLTALDDMTSWMQTLSGASTVTSILITLFAVFVYPSIFSQKKDAIYELRIPSILTGWLFFSKRYDLLASSFKRTGEKVFQFRVLKHSVVAVRGEDARQTFFNNRSLNFTEGYRIFRGGIPVLKDIDIDTHNQDNSWFIKNIHLVLHKDRLTDIIPTLLEDVSNRMMEWGKQGQIDPFEDVYDLIFQMTVRMTTCRELSDDQEALSRLRHQYRVLMQSATPTASLFPWFPGTAKRNRAAAMRELFKIIHGYIETRRSAAVPTPDAIDVFISEGLGNDAIIEFILGVVFAGVVNTGINTCWILVFLAANPDWKRKVITEVKSLIEKHTSSATVNDLHKRLYSVPFAAWEDEMPDFDLVIRETLRLTVFGAALRRNVLEDIQISGKVVKKGAFMAYQMSDAHMDPEIYYEPETFDPSRFGPGREEDKKGNLAFMGWGAGRHPCTGTRVAKLEIKIIVALFLTMFEYDLVDGSGNYPDPFPTADRNDIQAKPLGDRCYLRFKRAVV